MKNRALLRRMAWTVAIAALWLWGGKVWYGRAKVVFRSDPSSFWSNVTLPGNIEMATPGLTNRSRPLDKVTTDRYSLQLLKIAPDPKCSHMEVSCDISALDWLGQHATNRLCQYLACHPGWRFVRQYDGDTAERRVLKNGQWHAQHWRADYSFDLPDGDFTLDYIESDCDIVFGSFDFYGTKCKSGESVRLDVEPREKDLTDSEVVCYGKSIVLDVSERSSFPTSRLMQTVFNLTKEEFGKVAGATNWAMLKATLPEGSVRRGPAAIDLLELRDRENRVLERDYFAWVNPGERGETYLRAFEVSQCVELGTEATNDRAYLQQDTIEYAGWSDDPEEKFMVGSRLRFYDINKGQSFAMRLEAWFRPANGRPERKLVERVFKIEGGGK